MAVGGQQRLILELDAELRILRHVVEALVDRIALGDADPQRSIAELFERISILLDPFEMAPLSGEYEYTRLRHARIRELLSLFASQAAARVAE
jgi:hypothetical protein